MWESNRMDVEFYKVHAKDSHAIPLRLQIYQHVKAKQSKLTTIWQYKGDQKDTFLEE
jgi:hypothetical protein